MDISVILATFRRPQLLRQSLSSISELDADGLKYEVLVVDNAGDEATARVVRELSNKVTMNYVVEPQRGQNHARNRVIGEARGELIVFTDDDVIVTREWLRELWAGAWRWPDDAVFGGRILPKWPDGRAIEAGSLFLRGAYVIADWELEEGPYWAGNVWSPNMAIRAWVFRDGARFDPEIGPDGSDNYVMGSETELTMRLEGQGLRAIYLPKSVVHHQIRPEQMDPRWLYGRSFRSGRAAAFRNPRPKVVTVCGIPRYLLRELGHTFIRHQWAGLTRNGRVNLDSGVDHWYVRGLIHQYWKQRKGLRHGQERRGAAAPRSPAG